MEPEYLKPQSNFVVNGAGELVDISYWMGKMAAQVEKYKDQINDNDEYRLSSLDSIRAKVKEQKEAKGITLGEVWDAWMKARDYFKSTNNPIKDYMICNVGFRIIAKKHILIEYVDERQITHFDREVLEIHNCMQYYLNCPLLEIEIKYRG